MRKAEGEHKIKRNGKKEWGGRERERERERGEGIQ